MKIVPKSNKMERLPQGVWPVVLIGFQQVNYEDQETKLGYEDRNESYRLQFKELNGKRTHFETLHVFGYAKWKDVPERLVKSKDFAKSFKEIDGFLCQKISRKWYRIKSGESYEFGGEVFQTPDSEQTAMMEKMANAAYSLGFEEGVEIDIMDFAKAVAEKRELAVEVLVEFKDGEKLYDTKRIMPLIESKKAMMKIGSRARTMFDD